MKKYINRQLLSFILGAVIFGGISFVSATSIFASDIKINPSFRKSNGEKIRNVNEAIEELYNKNNSNIVYGEDESADFETYKEVYLGFKPKMVVATIRAKTTYQYSGDEDLLGSYVYTDNKKLYFELPWCTYDVSNQEEIQVTDTGFKWHVNSESWNTQHLYYYALK